MKTGSSLSSIWSHIHPAPPSWSNWLNYMALSHWFCTLPAAFLKRHFLYQHLHQSSQIIAWSLNFILTALSIALSHATHRTLTFHSKVSLKLSSQSRDSMYYLTCRDVTELFMDVGAPLTNMFLKVLIDKCSRSLQYRGYVSTQKIYFRILIFLNFVTKTISLCVGLNCYNCVTVCVWWFKDSQCSR